MDKVKVTIHHKKQVMDYFLRKGLNLQVLEKISPELEFDCRAADCGICVVKVRAGQEALSPRTDAEEDFLKAMRAEPDERLACQCRVFGDITLEVEDFI